MIKPIKRFKVTSPFLVMLIAGCLHSCTLHPPYQRPKVETPDHWRVEVDESTAYINNDWWMQLNDPILDGLIIESLECNKNLKVAIARVEEFMGQLRITDSALYPQISANAQVNRQEVSLLYSSLGVFGGKRTFNSYIGLLNASYDLDIWGKIRSASEASLANLLGEIQARREVVLTLVTNVAGSYIQLRQYDKQLLIARETLKSFTEAYEIQNKRFLGGAISELDAKQAEAEMEVAAAQVLQFELLVEQQENMLSVLIGHPPQAIVRGNTLDQFVLPLNVPAGLPSELLRQRPDVMQAEQAVIAANAEVGVALAQFFPDFSLTGFYGNESTALHNLLTSPGKAWQYGASVVQEIFTGGRLTGQVQIAEAQVWEAYYMYEQIVLDAFREVDNALIAHQQSKKSFEIEKRRVAALKRVLMLATLQYNNGQVDYLNVLDAQRTLFASELDLVAYQSEIFLTLVSIYKALGGGWVIEADDQAIQNSLVE